MSDGNGKIQPTTDDYITIPIGYQPGTPFDQVIAFLVMHCHGPRKIIGANEKIQWSELKFTFKCAEGHTHRAKWVNVAGAGPRLLLEVIEPLKPKLTLIEGA